MPGGIIQIAEIGSQDFYLVSNPKISFFKNVYKKYTQFSMEMITVPPKVERELNKTREVKLEFEISRDADLVNDVYFVFELPNIFSDASYQFQWIKRIGEYIVKDVKISIGSRQLDKHYGEWLHIWNELNLDKDKVDGYNELIGNVPEMYDPKTANGGSSYPASSSPVPSIRSRKIYLPLSFWFNQYIGSALPIIAMQYDTMPVIEFTLRPFEELYTIIDTDRKRPVGSTDAHNLGQFLEDGISISSLDINPNLEVNYIFLDTDERKRFAGNNHEYLIKKIFRVEDSVTPSTNNDNTYTVDLKISHPVTQLSWVLRRTDLELVNDWSNFTNWPTTTNPIYDTDNPYGTNLTLNTTTYPSYKNQDLMLDAKLILDGQDRFATKDNIMLSKITSLQHNKKISSTNGIYTYSFAIENSEQQPSGACNMSNHNKIQLQMTINRSPGNQFVDSLNTHDYNITIYSYYYNIFKLEGGLADMAFSD